MSEVGISPSGRFRVRYDRPTSSGWRSGLSRAGEALSCLGLALAALALGVVLVVSAGSSVWLMCEDGTGYLTQSMSIYTLLSPASWDVLAAGLAGGVVVALACWAAWRHGSVLDSPRAPKALPLGSFVAQLALILAIQTRGSAWGDSWMVNDMVGRALEGGIESIFSGPYDTLFYDARLYFSCYPFQAGFFWLLYGLRSLFGDFGLMALQLLSALANSLAALAVLDLGSSLARGLGARRVLWVLTALCLPMYALSTFLYLNALGFGLALVFLAAQARAMRARGRRRLLWLALSLPPLALALSAKATCVLFAIAAVLAWVVLALRGQVDAPGASHGLPFATDGAATPGEPSEMAATPGQPSEMAATPGEPSGAAAELGGASGAAAAAPGEPSGAAPAAVLAGAPSAEALSAAGSSAGAGASACASARASTSAGKPAPSFREGLVGLAVCVLVVLVARGASQLPFEALRQASGGYAFGDALTTLNHLELGLRMGEGEFYVRIDDGAYSYAPGGWSYHANELWEESGQDAAVQNEEALALIAEDVVGFASDPAYALWFFSVKLATEWADPSYQALYYLSMCLDASGGRAVDPADTTTPAGLAATVLTLMLDGYQALVFASALGLVVASVRGRASGPVLLLAFVFLTGFGCYLLWEAKSVYVLPFAVALLPLSAAGLDAALSWCSRSWRTRRARLEAAS